MTNDLKNFLEGEKEIDYQLFCFDKEDESWSINEERLKERDTRLINFVLDLVEKEVDKIEVKKFGRYTIEKDAEEIINTIVNETKKCVSTIINNLRV